MADIRINALTEASASVTTDFLPIDGSTGTRKLSAFNPTFGGNATVGGTLTVSGATTSSSGSIYVSASDAAARFKVSSGVTDKNTWEWRGVSSGDNTFFQLRKINDAQTVFTTLAQFWSSGGMRLGTSLGASADPGLGCLVLEGTTASTTTSSGALVVGNGTSGGLGVGGNITLGGGVNIAGSASDPLPAGTSGVWTASGSGLRINSAGYTFASLTGTSVSDAKWTLNATTASSSTSTGALVVGNGTSGGLGVGGAINAGGALTVNGTGTSTIYGDLVVPGQGKAINAQGYFLFKGAYCNIFSRGTSGGWGTGLVFHSSNTDPSASIVHDPTTGTLTLYTNATASNYSSSDIALQVLTDKQVQVKATTASTGTSSGALVVSGGVGVAGAIYAGAAITSNYSSAANTGFSVINTNSAGSPGLYLEGDAGEYAIIRRGGSTYANPRTLEYVATGSGAKHLFNTTAQFDGTVIAAASSNAFRITTAQTPASATATGTAGTICWDTSYIYVCTATNTWKRVAISTW